LGKGLGNLLFPFGSEKWEIGYIATNLRRVQESFLMWSHVGEKGPGCLRKNYSGGVVASETRDTIMKNTQKETLNLFWGGVVEKKKGMGRVRGGGSTK